MNAKTYSLTELESLHQNRDFEAPTSNTYYEGLQFKKEDGSGIHYWSGFPRFLGIGKDAPKEDDYRYIAVIDPSVMVSEEIYAEFYDEDSGEAQYRKCTQVETPVQGLIQLQINPRNRQEMWLCFIEVHSDFRGKGVASAMLAELVQEMKRNGLVLARSRVSESAPKWLKPKIDALLNENGIPWTQPEGFI